MSAAGTPASRTRCPWAGTDPLYVTYHDDEWGVPNHDDRHLFEMLILEGAQAGLAWITILRKRENYRAAFDHFDAAQVARYDRRRIERLMQNPGIVRNRLKIEAAVRNARATLAAIDESGSLDALLWQFVAGRPIVNRWKRMNEIPAQSDASRAMSRTLKKRGFTW